MKRRLYFVWRDVESAKRAEAALLLRRVGSRHIRFAARPGTAMAGLREASILQTSDFVHSLRTGSVAGAATGLFAGLLLAAAGWIDPFDFWPAVFLVLTFAGVLFGAWASSLIGISAPNRQLRRFAPDLEAGRVLMMVDVPAHRIGEIGALLGSADTGVARPSRYTPVFS